jgi:hypothetical protein
MVMSIAVAVLDLSDNPPKVEWDIGVAIGSQRVWRASGLRAVDGDAPPNPIRNDRINHCRSCSGDRAGLTARIPGPDVSGRVTRWRPTLGSRHFRAPSNNATMAA